MLKVQTKTSITFISDDPNGLAFHYYRWALMFYILDPFSQLNGSDIDG